MMANTNSGTIHLPTPSAIALWQHEIVGQISDGHWENAGPRDHYRFWCHLDVALGAPHVDSTGLFPCVRWYYGLNSLVSMKWDPKDPASGYVLRGRMLKLGRMGRAMGEIHVTAGLTYADRVASEKMPATHEEFMELRKTDTDLAKLDMTLALNYYNTAYDLSDLRKDIKSIMAAMKTMAPPWRRLPREAR